MQSLGERLPAEAARVAAVEAHLARCLARRRAAGLRNYLAMGYPSPKIGRYTARTLWFRLLAARGFSFHG
jgi:hypothetical protein